MYLISGYTLIMLQVLCVKFSRQLTQLWSLRHLRSRLHTTVSLLTDFEHLLNSKLPLIVRKMIYTLTVGLGCASDAFQGRLTRNSTRTKLVPKTPIPKVLARVSFCWPLITICGKNVYTFGRASDQIEIFSGYNLPEIPTFSLLQSSSILRGKS